MYQFCLSVNKDYSHWYDESQISLSSKLSAHNAIMASKDCGDRLYVSLACENRYKTQLVRLIKEVVTEMFLTCVKRDYIRMNLPKCTIKEESFSILLHTLVAFDRDAEKEIIERNLVIKETLALDGFFNFRLRELKKRWDDITQLAAANSMYLNNDETLNELLKFLMSAVSPKIMKLDIVKCEDEDGEYSIYGSYKEGDFEYKLSSTEKLMEYLISVAPLELTLHGIVETDKLYKRLTSIFDVKSSVQK